MGSNYSHVIDEETMEEYVQLSYLSRKDILCIHKRFCNLWPKHGDGKLQYRVPFEAVIKIFPEFKINPFCDRLFTVFSSLNDENLSFEDMLDLFSVLSKNCPDEVKASWAFKVFDFSNENSLNIEDIEEAIDRLVDPINDAQLSLTAEEKKTIASAVLEEMDMDKTGEVTKLEFIHGISKMPDFGGCFTLKL